MTRRSAPTTKLDECGFDPGCPFDCPFKTCVKEYPGGQASYEKDLEFLALITQGLSIYEAAEQVGIGHRQATRRYQHATSFAVNQTQEVSTA